MLRVGIDVTGMLYGRGVSRYTSNLVTSLLEQPKELRLSLFGSALRGRSELIKKAEQLKKNAGAVKTEVVIQSYPPSLYSFLWNYLAFPKIRKTLPNIDVFHSWDWIQPPDHDLPLVSTVHDLAILKYPETAHSKILAMHQRSWKILKERQAVLLAVSQTTKRDIMELLDIPAQQIIVSYEALPREVIAVGARLNEERVAKIMAKLKLDRPFALFVGTQEPRKNLSRLVEAWEPLASEIDLVIAGAEGWGGKPLSQSSQGHLRFVGRVSDSELAALYSNATVFVFPSLYEGFGLPILEAFYFGTPVVTSNLSSMPEVAGNAAELVNPLEVESIRSGMTSVLAETDAARDIRQQRMIVRQHAFSWESVAQQTLEAYHQAVESKI